MTRLPLPLQTIYAELLDRSLSAQMRDDFPDDGTFVKQTRNGRIYWYFQSPESGRQRQKYVGPDSDELRDRIRLHREKRSSERERRQMVAALKRVGLVGPDPLTGRILDAMAREGVFRLRAVVVGTTAYQTYSAILGVRLPEAATMTNDLDLAQFHGISIAIEDAIDLSLGELLKGIDARFEAVPYATNTKRSMRYALGSDYRVEVLTPNRGPDRDEPARLPALKAEGQPLRFLDFLIRDEMLAAALYGPGIAINVPAPERYAIHKLLVSRRRRREDTVKIQKDLAQADTLLRVLSTSKPHELRDIWEEAYARGDTWRKLLGEGLSLISTAARDMTLKTVGAKRRIVDGLDLNFAAPSVRYDSDRDVVVFRGEAAGESVRCAITHTAFEDFAEVESLDGDGCLAVFRDNRPIFERMLRIKYLEWPIEQLDEVLIKSEDIDKLLAQVKSASAPASPKARKPRAR